MAPLLETLLELDRVCKARALEETLL